MTDCPGLALAALLLLASPAAAAPKAKTDRFSVKGYVHIQWKHDFRAGAFPNHGFSIRRARVKFRYTATRNIRGAVELGCDKLNLTVKDVYVEYRAGSALTVIAGRHKLPFSREQLCPATRLPMAERSAVNDAFGDRGYLGRDIGVMAEGKLFRRTFPVEYAVGVFNGAGDAFTDYDNAKQFVERIAFTPVRGLSIGLNATQHTDSATRTGMLAWGADASYRFAGATVEAEALYGNAAPGVNMLGGYVLGLYRLGAFEPGVRYERLHEDLRRDFEHRFIHG